LPPAAETTPAWHDAIVMIDFMSHVRTSKCE
jgi:hypothetical protein